MAKFVLKKCPCLRPPTKEVHELDYRHSNLYDVPGEVFLYERTLEELYLDSNQIHDLPRELFYCHGLRKMCVSDNEIRVIPPAIGSLIYLHHLDISKNGIIDLPDNIKCCKNLSVFDISVNPLGKIPEGFTQLVNLTELFLNDAFLDYLPGNFGRLSKLKILELRENHLKTLPNSVNRFKDLEKLDIGHNQFTELPDVCGELTNLLELWCDHNSIALIHPSVGNLKQLMSFDASKNRIQHLPEELSCCTCLADLHLSQNELVTLPQNLGNMVHLTTLKVDDNHLVCLPHTIGGLKALSELDATSNDLTAIPPGLGRLRNLRTLYLDDNLIESLPAEVGSCSGITVFSIRANKLTYLPDEIGRIPHLRVLNLTNNLLESLPFSFIKLKQLQALWLSENQTKPLITFQTETDPETGMKVLTCYLLPQGAFTAKDDESDDTNSFHASIWEEEREQRQKIRFKFDGNDEMLQLCRHPTPYPKEMREQARHARNLALRESIAPGCGGPAETKDRVNVSEITNQEKAKMPRPLSPNLQDARKLLKDNTYSERHATRQSPARECQPEPMSPVARSPSPVASLRSVHSTRSVDSIASEPWGRSRPDRCDADMNRREKSHHNRPLSAITPHQRLKQLPKTRVEGRHARPQSANLSQSALSQQPASITLDKTFPRSNSEMSYAKYRNDVTNSRSMPTTPINPVTSTHTDLPHPVVGRNRVYSNRNYESDIGYRSDTCRYRDDVYHSNGTRRSNSQRSDVAKHVTHNGYQSDQNAQRSRRVLPESSARNSCYDKPHSWTKDGYASDLEAYSARMFNKMCRTSSLSTNVRNNTEKVRSSLLEISRLSLQQLSKSANIHKNTPQTLPEGLTTQDTGVADGDSVTVGSETAPPISPGGDFDDALYTSQTHPDSRDWQIEQRLQGLASQLSSSPHSEAPRSGNKSLDSSVNQSVESTPPPYTAAPPYHKQEPHRRILPTPNKTTTPQSLKAYCIGPGPGPHAPNGHTSYSNPSPQMFNHLQTQESPRTMLYHQQNQLQPNHSPSSQSPANNLSPNQPLHPSHSYSMKSPTQYEQDYNQCQQQPLFDHTHHSYNQFNQSHRSPNQQHSPFNQSDVSHISSNQSAQPSSPSLHMEDLNTSGRDFISYQMALQDGSMSRYDDMDEPVSQVSSSTDSGFVHGTHAFDHLGLNTTDSTPSSTPRQSIPSPGLIPKDLNHSHNSRDLNLSYNNNHGDVASQYNKIFSVRLSNNPGLGFSIAGGLDSSSIPFNVHDKGIYVTKIQPHSAAQSLIHCGDKILEVNGIDFCNIDHASAVSVLKACDDVSLVIQRLSPPHHLSPLCTP